MSEEKKEWSVIAHAEIFVMARNKEEAIERAWHDVMTDTENIIKIEEAVEIEKWNNILHDKKTYSE